MLGLITKVRDVHPDIIEIDVHKAAPLLKVIYLVVLIFVVRIIM
jgi:hypothetical protein